MASKAWSGNSAIFVVADESDYNGDTDNGGWADPSGCCDSPIVAAGSPSISPTWPGGVYGGGLSPEIVVTRNGPRGYVRTTRPIQPLLATDDDRAELAPRLPRPRG